ncbi:lytic transglycosylase domain-containing protein [Humidesulfovibrio sp.]
MNSDITDPVKAQSAQNLQSAAPMQPSLASAQPRKPARPMAKPATLDDDADLEPDMSAMPLTPGQTGTLLEPEVTSPPTAQEPLLTDEQRRILGEKSGLDFDLDLFESKEVERYFAYYTGPARETFSRWLKRAETHLPHVRQSLIKNGLPQDLAMLPFAESGYNCYAYSWAGAGGMWQFMPYTGRKFGLNVDWWIDERRDPRLATEAAGKYLAFLNDMFGDWYLALAAYNAGEGKISRALAGTDSEDFLELVSNNNRLSRRARLKPETQNYVPKFIAITKIFQNLEALGFEPVRWDAAPRLETVSVPGGTDLLALAKAGGLTWDEFHLLNPAFRRQVSPPDRNVSVAIPVEKKTAMLAYLENPGMRPAEGFIAHQVKKGESLKTVAETLPRAPRGHLPDQRPECPGPEARPVHHDPRQQHRRGHARTPAEDPQHRRRPRQLRGGQAGQRLVHQQKVQGQREDAAGGQRPVQFQGHQARHAPVHPRQLGQGGQEDQDAGGQGERGHALHRAPGRHPDERVAQVRRGAEGPQGLEQHQGQRPARGRKPQGGPALTRGHRTQKKRPPGTMPGGRFFCAHGWPVLCRGCVGLWMA